MNKKFLRQLTAFIITNEGASYEEAVDELADLNPKSSEIDIYAFVNHAMENAKKLGLGIHQIDGLSSFTVEGTKMPKGLKTKTAFVIVSSGSSFGYYSRDSKAGKSEGQPRFFPNLDEDTALFNTEKTARKKAEKICRVYGKGVKPPMNLRFLTVIEVLIPRMCAVQLFGILEDPAIVHPKIKDGMHYKGESSSPD